MAGSNAAVHIISSRKDSPPLPFTSAALTNKLVKDIFSFQNTRNRHAYMIRSMNVDEASVEYVRIVAGGVL